MRKKRGNKPPSTPQKKEDSPQVVPPEILEKLQSIPPEILEKLPEETRLAIFQSVSFRGPLPPPALFAQYEKVLDGSSERILKMSEREQEQRHDWDNTFLDYQGKEIIRGQWLGFGLGALAILGGIYCAIINQPWVAAVLVGTALANILTAFMKKND